MINDIPVFSFSVVGDLYSSCNKNSASQVKPWEFVPTLADPDSTGYDVRCASPGGVTLTCGEYFKIPLGIRMYAPKGWWMQLVPRSSSFAKKNIHALYGVIDETYENELVFAGQYLPNSDKLSTSFWGRFKTVVRSFFKKDIQSNQTLKIEFGERIAQLIPVKRPTIIVSHVTNEDLDYMYKERDGSRGKGGFGSTG